MTSSFQQLNLVVRDMEASLAFYRRLGLAIEPADHPDWKIHHASATAPSGVCFELNSIAFAQAWNPGLLRIQPGGSVVFVEVPHRADVDATFGRMKEGGAPVQQPPTDAFWGARYAIVEDPDGRAIGITSPPDDRHRKPPPPAPIRAGVLFEQAAPILQVSDVEVALARYRKLGFTGEAYREGDGPDAGAEPTYGFLSWGPVNLHVRRRRDLDAVANITACYIYVDDADALYAQWAAAGTDGTLGARCDTPYRLREFEYTDPDGNVLRVGSRLAAEGVDE